MLDFAIAGHPAFRVDRRELKRSGACYTVDTLAEIQREDPSRELVFLMGADSLDDFPTWREPARIVELAELAIVNRGGLPEPDLWPLRDVAGEQVDARVRLVMIPAIEIASSDIRWRVAEGRSIRFMTPRAVECYIESNDLYRSGQAPAERQPR